MVNALATWSDAGTWLDIYDDEFVKWNQDEERPVSPTLTVTR